jgi:hypothetical protein
MPAASRLVWQAGAPGLAGAAHTLIPPLPPRRPDDIVVTGALGAPRVQAATLPAASPAAGIPHPLPPVRPALRSVQVAAAGTVAVPRAAEPAPGRAAASRRGRRPTAAPP